MTKIEAAWLAGFLDGDGSFMITKANRARCHAPVYEAVVAATGTDRRLIEKCRDLCGGGKMILIDRASDRWKNAYVWQLKGLKVAPAIEAILPHLVSKAQQARLLLKLRSLTKIGSPAGRFGTRKTEEEVAERAAIYAACQQLNRRGPDVAMALKRIEGDGGLFSKVAAE